MLLDQTLVHGILAQRHAMVSHGTTCERLMFYHSCALVAPFLLYLVRAEHFNRRYWHSAKWYRRLCMPVQARRRHGKTLN